MFPNFLIYSFIYFWWTTHWCKWTICCACWFCQYICYCWFMLLDF